MKTLIQWRGAVYPRTGNVSYAYKMGGFNGNGKVLHISANADTKNSEN